MKMALVEGVCDPGVVKEVTGFDKLLRQGGLKFNLHWRGHFVKIKQKVLKPCCCATNPRGSVPSARHSGEPWGVVATVSYHGAHFDKQEDWK